MSVTSEFGPKRKARQDAAKARWEADKQSKVEWETMPMDECRVLIAHMRTELERGGQIYNRRLNEERPKVECYVCGREIANGFPAQTVAIRDHATGLYENRNWCSAECVALTNIKNQGGNIPMMNHLVK